MTTAGGGGVPRTGGGAWGWNLAAKGLENFNSTTEAAKVVGSGLVNMAGVGLQQLGNALAQIGRR